MPDGFTYGYYGIITEGKFCPFATIDELYIQHMRKSLSTWTQGFAHDPFLRICDPNNIKGSSKRGCFEDP